MSLLAVRRPLAWNGSMMTLLGLGVAAGAGVLLIWLPPAEGIVVVGVVFVTVGALIEPFVGLAAGLLIGPLRAYLSAEVPQVPPQVGHAFVALGLASWLIRGLAKRDVRILGGAGLLSHPVLLSTLVFVGAALFSLWDAVGLLAYGLPELIKWVEMVFLLIFVQQHLVTPVGPGASDKSQPSLARSARRRLQWLLFALLAGGLFQALVGLWQFGLRGDGPDHFRIPGSQFYRAYGTFEQPNPYGGYLGLTAAFVAGMVFELVWGRVTGHGKRGKREEDVPSTSWFIVVSLVSAAVMVMALVASWSRGAWMGFGAATLVMAAALPRKPLVGLLLILALAVAGLSVHSAGVLPESFTARLTSFVRDIRLEDVRGVPINEANYAVIERLAHWQAALSMVRFHPLTGVGLGCYEAAYATFALINWPIALGHAHNIYLNVLAETGFIGLTAYLVLWGVLFWQTWVVTRRAHGLMRGVAVGLLGAWAHLTVHHILDNLYVNNVHLHLGVLFGLTAFIIRRTDEASLTYDH